MESSNAALVLEATADAEVPATAAPPVPAPLIMLESADDAGVCAVDGSCD